MKLTANFTLAEFASKDGAPMPPEVAIRISRLATWLQKLRDELQRPITINSGYRSPAHNESIGGAKNSQHLLGNAADIVVDGMTPQQVADRITQLHQQGKLPIGWMKIYPTFVHYDIRGVYAE